MILAMIVKNNIPKDIKTITIALINNSLIKTLLPGINLEFIINKVISQTILKVIEEIISFKSKNNAPNKIKNNYP
jgi:hypothetical protein